MRSGKCRILCSMLSLVLAIVLLGSLCPVRTDARTTKVWYFTEMSGMQDGIKKMKLKGNKLTIWGSFGKAYTQDRAHEQYSNEETRISYRKKTFTLSSNVKFYAVGGEDGYVPYERELFEEVYVKQPDMGLGFAVMVRNGKVVRIETQS